MPKSRKAVRAKHRTSPTHRAEHILSGAEGRHRGAQPDNDNARTHGFYAEPTGKVGATIEDVVADVQKRQHQLSSYIDEQLADGKITTADILSLFALHSQTASRLGRLLRDERALSGKAADGIAGAIAAAIAEIATEKGWDIT